MEGSWYWATDSMGRRYARCRECKRINRQKNRDNSTASARREKARVQQREYRARLAARINAEDSEGGDVLVAKWLKQQQAVSAPWNQLALTGDAQVSLEELNDAMEMERTPCFKRPAEFIDFADPRYPDENQGLPATPSAQAAEVLCSGCPVWDLCRDYGQSAKPDFGIYGGKVYVGGKPYKQKSKKEEAL